MANPKDYNIAIFLRFMLKMLQLSLDNIYFYEKKTRMLIALSPSAREVLACFKEHPEKRLTVIEIENTLNIPRRTITSALSRLVKEGFIQRLGKARGIRYQLQF